MNGKKPLIFAHRGGRAWAPENTLAAFRRCLEAGVYGVELDVHRCQSGELVVLHDARLEKTTSGSGLIGDKTLAELRTLSTGVRYGAEFAGEHIPTLDEVLDLIAGRMVVNIEIKNTPVRYPGIEDDLLAVLERYGHADSIIISCFDHDVLERIHRKAPRYKLGVLLDRVVADLPHCAKRVGALCIHPRFGSFGAEHVAAAHRAGLELNTWTVNSADDWLRAYELGVDAIVTDDPDACFKFLATLPQTHARPSRRSNIRFAIKRILVRCHGWWRRFRRRRP